MPQISKREFEVLPLRVHAFLADVPLHDVWAVDLPRPRAGITLDEFRRGVASARLFTPSPVACERCSTCGGSSAGLFTPSPVVRALLGVRLFVGRCFGWDRTPSERTSPTFADRLTPADRTRSLAPAGMREGLFRVVYRFENEQLDEIINSTAHAAALSALVEMANSYRFYFAVYVRNVSWLTPLYMTLIDPLRKLIVYPSLLRSVRANWNRTIGDHI